MEIDEIMFTCKSGIGESSVEIEFRTEYNRKPHASHDKLIENLWMKKCSDNHRLYNATKFRLDGVKAVGDKVHLLMGLTNYKEFITTNLSGKQEELRRDGLKDYINTQSYLSDALGVGAVLTTTDDENVLIRRNEWVAEAGGLFDVPGGHPEPQEIVQERGLSDVWEIDPLDIAQQLFHSILSEIHNEVNIPMECLREPVLIGITRNPTTGGRPSATFIVHCSMSSLEVSNVYNIGGSESDESTDIIFIPHQELKEYKDHKIYPLLAPSAKAALKIFSQFQTNI